MRRDMRWPGKAFRSSRSSGMTLVELMVAVLLLLPILTVVMQNFITCMTLNSSSEDTSKVIWQERSLLAAMEKTSFHDIKGTYDKKTFPLAGPQGYLTTYVDEANSITDTDLLVVYISATWKDRSGRYTGEDVNLNGTLDAGEDKNGNDRLDSNVGFSTFIYDKG